MRHESGMRAFLIACNITAPLSRRFRPRLPFSPFSAEKQKAPGNIPVSRRFDALLGTLSKKT